MVRAVALLLTVLTGFSGLVYEVAWQRYLATLLGSDSEATSAVLGIFLGGLSVGYWLFGRVTRSVVARAERQGRPPRLLLVYGLLEGSIGCYVLAFPWLFRGVQLLSYSIPHSTGGLGFALDVCLSALLIGPASILMGGTIPMLTQALARSLDDATRFHAFVYAFNTAGAFAGALAAGFYLVPRLGLENVMLAMGCINLGAGALFGVVGFRRRAVIALSQAGPTDPSEGGTPGIEGFGFYATIALLTGFAMMTMQTVVIRLGVLSLGPSQVTFSMVVAVFVLAIALGSFAVSAFSHIPTWVIVANQWGIALFFLLLYPWVEDSPYGMMLIRTMFQDSNGGFYGFYLMALLAILVVIGPAVLLSGASLPLLFHHLRRQVDHLGDLAGYLYSWNTVGSLLGALLGGYALLFWLDLHQVYRIAIAALLMAAGILTVRIYRRAVAAGLALVPLLAVVTLLPAWRPELLYSGLFRKSVYDAYAKVAGYYVGAERFILPHGGANFHILFHADDPTASVVARENKLPDGRIDRSIASQGKSDADTLGDYGTTGLLAALPAIFADKAERAFVIGWGVGITAGELGTFDGMKEVDVAEITPGILEAAPLFDFATQDASRNPKIHVIRSDAYRALMRSEGTYDVIVSAPSQAWVAGVEMLFTREFLEATRKRLSPGGVYCQFIHRYEMDDASLALVLRSYASVYEHVAVWQDVNQSLLLLGFEDARRANDLVRFVQRAGRPDFTATLQRAHIPSVSALLAHELLPMDVVNALHLTGPLQSLYHPRLNDLAGRAFFREDYADLPFSGYGEPARIGARNSLLRRYAALFTDGLPDEERGAQVVEACRALGPPCNALVAEWMSEEPAHRETLERLIRFVGKLPDGLPRERLEELAHLFRVSRAQLQDVTSVSAARASEDFATYYHHAAPFPPQTLHDIWSSCRAGRPTEAACRDWVSQRAGARSDASFEDQVRECMTSASIGKACESGLRAAEKMLREGVVPRPTGLPVFGRPEAMR